MDGHPQPRGPRLVRGLQPRSPALGYRSRTHGRRPRSPGGQHPYPHYTPERGPIPRLIRSAPLMPDTSSPASVTRRGFLQASALAAAASPASGAPRTFELDEVSISELRDAIDLGRLTARAIAEFYLERIRAIDREGPG